MYQKIVASDNDGNTLYVARYNIYLKLAAMGTARKLGMIDLLHKQILIFRRAGHLLKKANAYGFNYQMLITAQKCKSVMLCCRQGRFEIPIKDILEKGSFLWFKHTGFERQIFLPVDVIQNYRAATVL